MGRTSFLWSTTTWAGAVLLVALASVISGGWSSVGASASLSIPAPKIVAAPSNPSDDQNPELSFKDAKFPDISFSCRLDQGPVVQCTGDTDHDGDRDQGEIQYRRLAPGPHCFHVFAVGRTHGVSPTTTFCWTISETNSATSISTVSGTPQFTAVNTMFGSLLVARVRDSPGHAVDGAKVTFTAPATGVSGTFASCAGGNPEPYACVVTTNASGLATSSAFTADANSGAYLVKATTPGVASSAHFSLTNSANFSISAANVPVLYPGTSQNLDLVFTNPNPLPITVDHRGFAITITTARVGCSASVNFAVTRDLLGNIKVPATRHRHSRSWVSQRLTGRPSRWSRPIPTRTYARERLWHSTTQAAQLASLTSQ